MYYAIFETPKLGQEPAIAEAKASKAWTNIEWEEIDRKDDFETIDAAEIWAETHPLWLSHPEGRMLTCRQGEKTE